MAPNGYTRFRALGLRQGMVACSAVLRDTPCTATASWIAYWKYIERPEGSSLGHASHGSSSEPPAPVNRPYCPVTGTVTSCPPLNGTGMKLNDRNSRAGAEGAASILYRGEEDLSKRVDEYKELFANPLPAAERGYIDDVIRPATTRQRLADDLRVLASKRLDNPAKKHNTMPL